MEDGMKRRFIKCALGAKVRKVLGANSTKLWGWYQNPRSSGGKCYRIQGAKDTESRKFWGQKTQVHKVRVQKVPRAFPSLRTVLWQEDEKEYFREDIMCDEREGAVATYLVWQTLLFESQHPASIPVEILEW
jgi:hypothetical protein